MHELALRSAVCNLPHPHKETVGEDAFLLGPHMVGVADGVGSWCVMPPIAAEGRWWPRIAAETAAEMATAAETAAVTAAETAGEMAAETAGDGC